MTKKVHETEERPSGPGEIRNEAGEYVAKVRYSLEVRREFVITETFGGRDKLSGPLVISGKIVIVDGERVLTGDDLVTLHLEDGRKLEIWAKEGDPISGEYTIGVVPGSGGDYVSE